MNVVEIETLALKKLRDYLASEGVKTPVDRESVLLGPGAVVAPGDPIATVEAIAEQALLPGDLEQQAVDLELDALESIFIDRADVDRRLPVRIDFLPAGNSHSNRHVGELPLPIGDDHARSTTHACMNRMA